MALLLIAIAALAHASFGVTDEAPSPPSNVSIEAAALEESRGLGQFVGVLVGPGRTRRDMIFYQYAFGRPAKVCRGLAKPPTSSLRHFAVLNGFLFAVRLDRLQFYR